MLETVILLCQPSRTLLQFARQFTTTDSEQSRPRALGAQVCGKLLNSRFKMVSGRLKDAFGLLGHVVTISQRWHEPDLQAALAADMRVVVAEVQRQGPAGQQELKVRAWP